MIDNLLDQANHEKQAAANLDLASDSKSKHPSADVSDGTRPAAEGARSAENKSDISKQVPNNVEESGSKNEAGGSENQADTMGTQSMEADETKGNVDTPKSTDPQIAGKGPGNELKMKYGTKVSADELVSGANALLKQLSDSLNVKSAEIATPAGVAEVEIKTEKKDEKEAGDVAGMYKAAAEAYPSDEEAGYVAASMLIDFLGEEKAAADQYTKTVDSIQKQASADAESYVSFLKGYQKSIKSAAMPGMPEGLEGMMGGAGAPPEAGMGGEGGGGEEAALAALAGAGGGEAGLGGEGGEEGGEGSDDASIIEAIAEALDEAGVTPEELAEAVAEAQGEAPMEGGEGMPPEGGGMPPEGGELAPAPAGEGMPPEPKLASAKSNRGQVKKAANRDALRSAVQRIVRGN